jgi:hypothetical protein
VATFRPDPRSQLFTQKTLSRKLRIIFIPWQEGSDEAKEWKDKSEQWNLAKPDKKFQIVYYQPHEKANAHLKAANADKDAVIYIRGHGSPGSNSLKANVLEEQRSLAMTDVCQRLIDMGLDPSFAGAIKFHSCYSATVFTDSAFKESHAAAMKSLESSRKTKEYLTTGLPKEIEDTKSDLRNIRRELDEEKAKFFWSRDDDKVSELATRADRRAKRVTDLEKQQLEGKGADAYIRERELRVPTGESIAAQGANYLRSKGFVHCSYFGYLGPMESLYAVDTSSAEQKEMHKFVNIEGLTDPPKEVGESLKEGAINPKAVRASTVRMKIL